jgi:hypothetical protein
MYKGIRKRKRDISDYPYKIVYFPSQKAFVCLSQKKEEKVS